MKNLFNIEKSVLHRGQYVGYSHGRVYSIKKSGKGTSYPVWIATRQNDIARERHDNYTLSATTLQILSGKLAALPEA